MKRQSQYFGYRFPPEIIGHAVWLYYRFTISFRDVEDLLAERGIIVSYDTIRQWCQKFGLNYARNLRKKQHRPGDTWFIDEVFLNINGQRQYLWRAVDQDGDVVDILVQSRRNKKAACRVFRKMLKRQGAPCKIVTDKLRGYSAARKEIIPSVMQCQDQYDNYRAEGSHQRSRQRERQMRRFKSPGQVQRFLCIHNQVHNLFNIGRHLLKACHYRMFRSRALDTWQVVTCAY